MIRLCLLLCFLLTCATALQCELAVSLDGLDFVSTFPVEADLRVWSSFLVERIQERTGEPFDEAARLRVLENMEAARRNCARQPSASCAVARPRGDELVRPARRDCKVLVTGTGRSGTTFLMKLFTAVGLETGFDRATVAAHVDRASGGGLESGFDSLMNASRLASTPKVLKITAAEIESLGFADRRGALASRLEYVIVPYRELSEVVASRARNGGGWGGLYTRFYAAGRETLARELERGGDELTLQYQLESALVLELALFLLDWAVPHVFVSYRRMLADPEYLYDALAPLVRAHGVGFEAFAAAYAEVRDDREPRVVSKAERIALRESVVVRAREKAS